MSEPATILRFDVFELDTGSGELRKNGDRIKLPPQPFRVLELLIRRGGEVLTRTDIRERIWCDDSFVDFEQGLNFCIRQIREALGDTADAPRFIETLPRRGYRFLLPVETPASVEPKAITAADRSAVPHAPAGSRDGLPGVQPAGSVDHFAVGAEIPGGPFQPGRIAICGRNAGPQDRSLPRPRSILIVTGTLLSAGTKSASPHS